MSRRQRYDLRPYKKQRLIYHLRKLYGDKCCYCAGVMCFDITIGNCNKDYIRSLEHIVDYEDRSRFENPDNLDNLLLSHRKCNSIVGGFKFNLAQKEYYIENPHKFIEIYLESRQINYKKE